MKKGLSILLSLIMLLSVCIVVPVQFSAEDADLAGSGIKADVTQTGTSKSQSEAISWVQSQNGSAIDYDGVYGAQCVDLIKAYYNYLEGYATYGNAVDYTWNDLPSGWYRTSSPSAGDIVVWGAGAYLGKYGYYADGTYGHVGIVTAVYSGLIDYYDQNAYPQGQKVGGHSGHTTEGVATFIHPNFYDSKSGINVGDDFYALILNQPNWVTIGQADNGNVQVVHESKNTYDRTLWHFTRVNDKNAYKVISLFNGKGLDVSGASGEARANVQCWPYNGNSAQLWYFQQNTDSYYLTADCTSMMMDLDNGDPSNGTNIHMYNQNSTSAQRFTIYTVSTSNKLNYNISAGNTQLEAGGKTTVTVGGTLSYVYSYKFHIIKPDGTEQVIDNKCNNVLNFESDDEGEYKVYAEIKNPLYTEKGSSTNKAVTINVGCAHSFSEEFAEASAEGQQGYIIRTCTKCGKVFKDNYMDYEDGWYTPANGSYKLPDLIKNDDKYTKQYHNYSEKIQTNSPGAGWVNKGVDHIDYVDDGGSYESQWELPTSNTRVLLYDYYYHFCIPGSGINSEANYEESGSYSHYDAVNSSQVSVVWTGDDNGHTVYVLHWSDGSTVYCQSGTTCDGAWGSHGQRSKAWYKMYVYQNKKEVVYYKWVKDSGWTDTPDPSADKITARFQANVDPSILGDADGDGEVTTFDVVYVLRHVVSIDIGAYEETIMNADVDGNGEVEVIDATYMQRYLVSMDTPYKIGEKV